MNVAGLFAGIGGFELGLGRAGHETILLCEIQATAQAVLRAHFPDIPLKKDIVKLKALPSEVELVAAGFPCQDLSQAGLTAGLRGHRSGLIGEVFRLLEKRKKARRPVPWVVIENVPFMLQLNGGRAIRAIIDEFERLGYRWAYRVIDSFSFGLAQRRERVYLVASVVGDPAAVLLADDRPLKRPPTNLKAYAHGFYWTEGLSGLGWAVDAVPTLKNGSTIGIASPPALLLPDGRLVKPGIRTAEQLQGFESDWTEPAELVGKPSLRWSLVGNAASVPVPEWLGRRLCAPGDYDTDRDCPFLTNGKAPKAARYDGTSRFEVEIGTDPVGRRPKHIMDIMGNDFTLLSERATAGFYSRAQRAKLRFPEGFLDAVAKHLENMSGKTPSAVPDTEKLAA
ncbi:MAG TPA: DNA (cytosine-5-)-methyltransferase [Burkholderiales bacterium]|nr:DNA (cytosine-5-)-methyltransferase [Burkholderiales bacterium]